jgi:tetratricopeptide (TPR) repeat protein
MRTVRALGIAVIACVLVAKTVPAHAQDPKRQAKKHLRAGDKARDRGDKLRDRGKEEQAIAKFEEALAEYQSAYELVANPVLYYAIAGIEERLGLDMDAYNHYRQVLEEVDELGDELRAEVEMRAGEVKGRLAVVTFVVEPEGAKIEVDGKQIGEAPLAEPLVMIPGQLALKITKEGYKEHEETGEYDVGPSTVEVFLEKKVQTVTVTPKPEPVVKPPPAPVNPARQRVIIGASVTGGLALTAIITGVAAQKKHSRFEDPSLSDLGRERARDKGKTYAVITDILWVGAIGAGAYTAYYYYTTYKPNQERLERRAAETARARRMWVSPYAVDDGAGVAVGGSF